MQLIQKLIYHRYRVAVHDGRFIQRPIVNAKAPASVLFLNQQHRTREGADTFLYDPRFEHQRHLPLYLGFLRLRIAERPNAYWVALLDQINGVLPPTRWWQPIRFVEDLSESLKHRSHLLRRSLCPYFLDRDLSTLDYHPHFLLLQ